HDNVLLFVFEFDFGDFHDLKTFIQATKSGVADERPVGAARGMVSIFFKALQPRGGVTVSPSMLYSCRWLLLRLCPSDRASVCLRNA
ncbi:MAG: hypothetical protein KDJ31_02040, partial [Candidatus Competibacteraceae bacterium]|nr:hypothetical protein [Candidatus Competibacteraceae bacterium]